MGLIADEQPAMYKVIETARLTHGKGMQSYLCMMAVRLLEMRRVLQAQSIYTATRRQVIISDWIRF